MRTLLPLLVMLSTATAAHAGSPEGDAVYTQFGIVVLMAGGFCMLVGLSVTVLIALVIRRYFRPHTKKKPAHDSTWALDSLPPFPPRGG